MADSVLASIRALLEICTPEEKATLFADLRKLHVIHEFENVIGAPAEMILEAVHRAPELTRRMLRGVIADAAFRMYAVAPLLVRGWKDITPEGNFAYDYKLDDGQGPVTVQVKLQRSERGKPVVKSGSRYLNLGAEVFIAETQKTRSGVDGDENKTRPYRFGEFDVLAVSMQPSTGNWNQYMYTLSRWLLIGKRPGELATMQPVAMASNACWTSDFVVAAGWLRVNPPGIGIQFAAKPLLEPKKPRTKKLK